MAGVPETLKVDNAWAFKSEDLKKSAEIWKIRVEYSTSYVHSPIGAVEKIERTLQNYVNTFLREKTF